MGVQRSRPGKAQGQLLAGSFTMASFTIKALTGTSVLVVAALAIFFLVNEESPLAEVVQETNVISGSGPGVNPMHFVGASQDDSSRAITIHIRASPDDRSLAS